MFLYHCTAVQQRTVRLRFTTDSHQENKSDVFLYISIYILTPNSPPPAKPNFLQLEG